MKNLHKLHMDMVDLVSKQSNCVTDKVGAIVVKDDRAILEGYNGTVSGFTNCCDKFGGKDMAIGSKWRILHGKWSKAFEIHGEMNLICYAAKEGIALKGTTIYCTYSPCNNCLKHMIQAGIKVIVYKHEYEDNGIDDDSINDRKELEKFVKLEHYKE